MMSLSTPRDRRGVDGGSGSSMICFARISREGLARERQAPGVELVQHDADRVDVGAVVDGRAAALLGRHVVRRADRRAASGSSSRSPDASSLAMPKSSSLTNGRPRVGVTTDVLGLEIAVDDALGVRGVERVADLRRGSTASRRREQVARAPGARASVMPSRSSITKYCRPSASWPNEKMSMMFGWRIRLTARASSMKRAPAPASAENCAFSTLIATCLPMTGWTPA